MTVKTAIIQDDAQYLIKINLLSRHSVCNNRWCAAQTMYCICKSSFSSPSLWHAVSQNLANALAKLNAFTEKCERELVALRTARLKWERACEGMCPTRSWQDWRCIPCCHHFGWAAGEGMTSLVRNRKEQSTPLKFVQR